MMFLPHPRDVLHKAWLYRLLIFIADTPLLVDSLRFKGGTCAAMRSLIDRFSIDLDFDLVLPDSIDEVRNALERGFKALDLTIKDKSQNAPQYFLKYMAPRDQRNTLKIDITFPPPKANIYEPVRLKDIDRIIFCQTIETMFANKLVALLDRYKKNNNLAGRDLYDIHAFFLAGFSFNRAVIEERRKQSVEDFFRELASFIQEFCTETIIFQDLHTLLAPARFKQIKHTLKQEILMFLS